MKGLGLEHRAMAATALSGLIWGIYWIPLRALDGAGITGVWAVVLFYLVPAILLVPLYLKRAGHLVSGGWAVHVAGIFAGSAMVLYAGALVFTDIVRALLFYYLTPLWSTLLAWLVLGEAITRIRWWAMGLAFVGLIIILDLQSGFELALNTGDWMGLLAGMVWAAASVRIRSDGDGNPLDLTLSYFFWGSVAALLLVLLPISAAGRVPHFSEIGAVLPWLVPVVILVVIPPALAIMWGASILSPGLVAILFMTEISAGAITAAIWANEAFGPREVAGIVLITTAGMLEPVLGLMRSRKVKRATL